jgi:hypothetical protein
LNVLIAVGLIIAVSGGLLRFRTADARLLVPGYLQKALMVGLLVIGVTSYSTRRMLYERMRRAQAAPSESVFYWSHLIPAIIASLAGPLGFVYGWWIDSSVQSVIPFWVVAFALGSLALPRTGELEYFDRAARGSESELP